MEGLWPGEVMSHKDGSESLTAEEAPVTPWLCAAHKQTLGSRAKSEGQKPHASTPDPEWTPEE